MIHTIVDPVQVKQTVFDRFVCNTKCMIFCSYLCSRVWIAVLQHLYILHVFIQILCRRIKAPTFCFHKAFFTEAQAHRQKLHKEQQEMGKHTHSLPTNITFINAVSRNAFPLDMMIFGALGGTWGHHHLRILWICHYFCSRVPAQCRKTSCWL